KQGFSVNNKLGIALNKRLIGIILRCLFNSLFSMLISSTPFVKCSREGKSLISLLLIRAFAISNCILSNDVNSSMVDSCIFLLKFKTAGYSGSTASNHKRKKRFLKIGII